MFFVKRFHLLLFLFLPSVLFAQQAVSYTRGATQLEDILPSSPEAASRVRYADVPFTHSLGASQYSVPLWELKGRELSLPISLEYSSNGIRLDEIAGVAGLGWALNAGGCITLRYRYTGKEDLGPDFGLGYHDFGARHYSATLRRWLVPDSKSEDYYGINPYVYCAGEPVRLVDTDGRDPIYALSFFGRARRIGDDGKSNNESYLVRGRVPTGRLLDGVRQSYEDTKQSKKENGGHSYYGDDVVTRWDEGDGSFSFINNDGDIVVKAIMRPFVVNGKMVRPIDASQLSMWWHTHPDIYINGGCLGSSIPSPKDIEEQVRLRISGFKGNSFVIGTRTNYVTFYNENGVLITVKWEEFLKMGTQQE